MSNTLSELIYVHDPMCSWCWGFDKTRRALFDALDGQLTVRRLVGGLAPDSDQPMPEDMQRYLQTTWKKIQERIPGTQFNFEFWTLCKPRRSTWPACRAVIAARNQDDEYDALMTRAIQQAYYLQARNPSDVSVLIDIATEIGLDSKVFETDLLAQQTQRQVSAEMEEAKTLGVEGFPSLVFLRGTERWRVPVDYNDSTPMLELIQQLLDEA